MIVHTDYNPDDPDRQAIEKTMPGCRPPHAVEGAVAVLKVIHKLLGAPQQDDPRFKLIKAVFTAIARHHSPQADRYHEFNLHPAARPTVAQVLGDLGISDQASEALVTSKSSQPIDSLLIQPDARDELLAYFLIVRVLRLADQEATSGKV